MRFDVSPQPNITITTAQIEEWESMHDKAMQLLGDRDKEADMKLITGRIATNFEEKGIDVRIVHGRWHDARTDASIPIARRR